MPPKLNELPLRSPIVILVPTSTVMVPEVAVTVPPVVVTSLPSARLTVPPVSFSPLESVWTVSLLLAVKELSLIE